MGWCMQLREINKNLYQKRFKQVALSLSVSLALLALIFSTLLIALFGGGRASNTGLNAAGVLIALALLLMALQKIKVRPFFAEVLYVWNLKQELNKISRRINKIKAAAEQGDRQAMVILNFAYQGSKQLWQLDDNTLMMDELAQWQAELETLQRRFNIHVSLDDYQTKLLQGV